jgi:hypothetical protein
MLLPLLAALMTASCAHPKYVEPSGASGRLAIVEADAPLWLVSIDGQKISNRGFGVHKEIRVIPGRHVLEISMAGFDTLKIVEHRETYRKRMSIVSKGTLKIPFIAKASKTYSLTVKKSPLDPYANSFQAEVDIHEFMTVK